MADIIKNGVYRTILCSGKDISGTTKLLQLAAENCSIQDILNIYLWRVYRFTHVKCKVYRSHKLLWLFDEYFRLIFKSAPKFLLKSNNSSSVLNICTIIIFVSFLLRSVD